MRDHGTFIIYVCLTVYFQPQGGLRSLFDSNLAKKLKDSCIDLVLSTAAAILDRDYMGHLQGRRAQ